MPLSNQLPLKGNQTYAIRSVLYPDQCAHEANNTNSNDFHPVIMLNCNSYDVPDQWLVTTNSSNASVVTIKQAVTTHYMSQGGISNSSTFIDIVGMPINVLLDLQVDNVSSSFGAWSLVQSNTSCGFRIQMAQPNKTNLCLTYDTNFLIGLPCGSSESFAQDWILHHLAM